MTMRKKPGATRNERGAVASIVALLLSGGVILGFCALAIDVGNIMWERRQLQNGADSAVLEFARICGTDSTGTKCGNSGDTASELRDQVGRNAEDGVSKVDYVCAEKADGTVYQFGTPACPEVLDYSALAECLPATSATSGFPIVELRSRTEVPGGSTILPYFFAQTVTNAEASVSACARATWGAPKNAVAKTPFTVSECEWHELTVNGSVYAEPPAYTAASPYGYGGANQPALPPSEQRVVLSLKDPLDASTACPTWGPGIDAPGAFGWLDNSNCQANIAPPGWVHVDIGGNFPNSCNYNALFLPLKGKVVDVPVFFCAAEDPIGDPVADPTVCTGGNGNNTYYYIRGWAKFYVSGWKVSGNLEEAIPGTTVGCAGGSRCISGWFTTGVIHVDEIEPPVPGGNDFGSIGVLPAG